MANPTGGNQFTSNPWMTSSIDQTVPTGQQGYDYYKSLLDKGENPFLDYKWPGAQDQGILGDPLFQLYHNDPRASYLALQAQNAPPAAGAWPGTVTAPQYTNSVPTAPVASSAPARSEGAPTTTWNVDPLTNVDPNTGRSLGSVQTPEPETIAPVANISDYDPLTGQGRTVDPVQTRTLKPGEVPLSPTGIPEALVKLNPAIQWKQNPNGTWTDPMTGKLYDPSTGEVIYDPGGPAGAGPGQVGGVPAVPTTPGPTKPSLTPGDEDEQFYIVSPQDPQLQQNFFSWLTSQIGAGATPFPGNLNAARDPLLNALYNFYRTGQGDSPGAKAILSLLENPRATIPDIINQMAASGLPIDKTQAWEAMIAAQQRNIDRTAANLRGQFAFSGNLAGTPFAQAMVDFYTQAAKDQNATLAAWQAQALEAARGRQMTAGELILGAEEGGQNRLASLATFFQNSARDLGTLFQGLDQQEIDRVLNEFVRTRPEYSPLLNLLFSASTTYPPTLQKRTGLGIGGALLGALPSLISKIPDLLKKIPGGAPTRTGTEADKKVPFDAKMFWVLPEIVSLIDAGNWNRPLVDNLLGTIEDLFGRDLRGQIETRINGAITGGFSTPLSALDAIMQDIWNTEFSSRTIGGSTGGGNTWMSSWWRWFVENWDWAEMGV